MCSLIQFFEEDVHYKPAGEEAIKEWIVQCVEKEGGHISMLNIIFCNDEYLLELNQRFLERETLTDVIAFDYHEEENEVSGDVFISIDRIRENADVFGQTLINETNRVIIHGVLHLLGYDDRNAGSKQKMTGKEDYYLSLLPF
jgi:probable rRNA maturation factor